MQNSKKMPKVWPRPSSVICTREQQTTKNNSSQNNIHCVTSQSHAQGSVERQMTVFKDNGNVWEVPLVTVSGTVKSKHEVMLKTARVLGQCQESEKSVPIRLLLNDCSQKSYVTNSLKVQSNLKTIRKQTVYLNTFGNNNYQK